MGAEEARKQLPDLRASGQRSLMALAGSGKGLWGADSTGTLRKLRDEWKR